MRTQDRDVPIVHGDALDHPVARDVGEAIVRGRGRDPFFFEQAVFERLLGFDGKAR